MQRARVVVVSAKGLGDSLSEQDENKILEMLRVGISLLYPSGKPHENLRRLFTPQDQIGVKLNTIGGPKLSTWPEVALSLHRFLSDTGRENPIFWDRTNRELKDAGYRLNMNRKGQRVYGTDSRGMGYDSTLVSHKNIGSLFSSIQSRQITASISLAILKDHGLAGVTASMKNYFGSIHNPNKYHDNNCNPYVAELFETPPIRHKHRLSILDALVVQYHRGPAYHSQWAENCGTLIFSTDAVAADFVGWQLIEKLRSHHGLPSLKEEQREPQYIHTAGQLGLGQSNPAAIEVITHEI
jgi:uncharacterized protein (DUF362 family)